MKNKKVTMKKLIAAVMSLAVIATSIYFMPQTDASAEDSTSTFQKQSYGAWKDTVPVNGSFEVGEEGMDVYGWSLISADISQNLRTDNPTVYLDSFQLKTEVEENGNKVAAFKKDGNGYATMYSQEVNVEAGKDYNLSLDYQIKDISVDIDPSTGKEYTSNSTIHQLIFLVQEIKESGESTFTSYKQGDYSKVERNNWETFNAQFKTSSDTEKVVIHCWLGGEKFVNETVYLDNIKLDKHDNYAVVNSSFEKTTYVSDGGRADGTPGPAGWKLTRATNSGVIDSTGTSAWENNFQATTTQIDNRDSVVAIEYKEGKSAAGYVLLQSDFIPVNAGQVCDLTAECKLVCYDADKNIDVNGYLNRGIGLNIACYDTDGNLLSNTGAKRYDSEGYLTSSTTGSVTMITNTKNSAGDGVEWKKFLLKDITTVDNTAYVKIGLYVGYALAGDENINPAGHFTLYFDNIGLDVDDSSLGYTQYQGRNGGVEDTTITDQRASYGIRKVNGGTGYEDAVQLYATVEQRTTHGVIFCRTFDVSPNVTYQVDLDMKIEGIEDSSTTIGADIALRYLDENKVLLETGALYNNDNNKKNTDGWEHKTYKSSTTTAPANAEYVEIVFLIGVNKTTTTNPDMRYTFANIAIEQGSNTNFWDAETGTYAKRALTDLLFKMLETDKEVSVKDLIDIKKAETSAIDMNLSGRINEDDADIMRWKLTGVTKSSELVR